MEHENVTTALPAPARTTTSVSTAQEKKPGIITLVRNLTSNTSFSIPASPRSGAQPAWEPTFLRPLPLIGIGALLASVCCLFASLGILIASDGQATEKWHPWSPSVFLAIFSAFVNRATQFALVQAIPIAWWYKAYNGATLHQLQRKWEASEGFFRAMKNARYEWGMAIAMTFCTLVVIDGPFLQKSSSVVAKQQTGPVKLHFPITPQMPSGFSGVYDHFSIATSDEAAPAISSYTYNSSIVANITGCSERATCRTKVHGPGLVIKNCSTETWPLDRNTLLNNRTATWGPGGEKRVAPMPLFNTQIVARSVRNNLTGPEELELRVGIANYTNCSGSYVQKYCSLISATLEYDVMVTSTNVLSFASPANTAKLISLANNTFINSSNPSDIPLTFSAFGSFMNGQISANVTMRPSSRAGQTVLNSASESYNNFATRYSTGEALCEEGFLDPTGDILADMNNLMFRAGIRAALQSSNISSRMDPNLIVNQTLDAEESLVLNVFHSDLRWFAGAAIFESLAIITIFPIFWGWWKLGVKITMSPLEILKAGEAPLLKEANSGAGSRGVVEEMGDLRVRFGVREDVTGVADGEGRVKREEVRRRLVLGEVESVGRPGRGEVFDE